MAAAAGPGAIQEVGSKEELDAAIAARDLVVVDFFAECVEDGRRRRGGSRGGGGRGQGSSVEEDGGSGHG